MLNKPFVLVVLAGLVAAGAGTGAYLAVRDNTATQGEPPVVDEPGTAPLGGEAVKATETILDAPLPDTPRGADAPAQPSPTPTFAPAPQTGQPRREQPAEIDRNARVEPAEPIPTEPTRTERRVATRIDAPPTAAAVEPEKTDEVIDDVPLAPWEDRPIGSRVEPEPTPIVFEDLIVSADSVIGLQFDTPVSSENAQVEDPVEARVTRDVMVGSRVAIPAGSQVHGSVVLVEPGGKVKEVARLGIRFHTLVMEEGVEKPIVTETIYREGKSPGGESVAKIGGGAVGGAIIGAILGGARGAAIGGSVGAGAGTAAVMSGDPNPATFPAGAAVTVRLTQPVTVTVEQ